MIQLVIAVALFIGGMAVGWKAHMGIIAQRDLAAVQAAERETLRRVDKIDTAAEKHEVTKEVIRTKFVPITEEIERVITKIEYRDTVCFSDDGLRVLSSAIAAIAPAASQPQTAVSTLKPPKRWFSRLDPAVGGGND